MSQQATTITIADIGLKMGTGKKGPWTLATIVGSDGAKYKTFNENLIDKAKEAIGSAATVEILFEATEKTFKNEKGETIPYVDREIKDLVIKKGAAAPAPKVAAPAIDGHTAEYWQEKDRRDFQRSASLSALQVCADIMAACLAAQVENYKFDDAMRIVKLEAKALYATYFKPLEGDAHDDDIATDAQEEAEIVQ